MKVGDVLDKARVIVNDNDPDGYRQDDPTLIGWLNDALATVCTIIPGLFTQAISHTCVAGYRQTLEYDRAVALVDIPGLPPADASALSLFKPGWKSQTAGSAVNWMRPSGEEPLVFHLYPPSEAGQKLDVVAIVAPDPLSSRTSAVPVPENLLPALVDYVVAIHESQDDEHTNSGKQAAAMNQFAARISGLAPGTPPPTHPSQGGR